MPPSGVRLVWRSALLVVLLATAAALPPQCTPIPLDPLGPDPGDCVRPLCDPDTGACAFAHVLPDGTPCADGAGVCIAGRCDCSQACAARACGPDGCGGWCGDCDGDMVCAAGQCYPPDVGPVADFDVIATVKEDPVAIAAAGDVVLLASQPRTLHVMRPDPTGWLRELARLPLEGEPDGVSVAGRWGVVVVAGERCRLIDLADPTAPVDRGAFADGLRPTSVAVLSEGRVAVGTESKGLWLFRIDDAEVARPIGNHRVRAPVEDIEPAGDLLYLAAGEEGIRVLDVSDPRAIDELASVPCGEHAARGLAADGAYLYAACRDVGLSVIDVTDPTAPRLVSAQREDERDQLFDVVVHGSLVYAVMPLRDLRVFDVTDPTAPRRLADHCRTTGNVPPGWPGWCRTTSIAATPGFVFALAPHMGVFAFRAVGSADELGASGSSEQVPLAAFYPAIGAPVDIVGGPGWFALVSDGQGLAIYDVSGTHAPHSSWTQPIPIAQMGRDYLHASLSGDTLYTVDEDAGTRLQAIDMARPDAPVAAPIGQIGGYRGAAAAPFVHDDWLVLVTRSWLYVFPRAEDGTFTVEPFVTDISPLETSAAAVGGDQLFVALTTEDRGTQRIYRATVRPDMALTLEPLDVPPVTEPAYLAANDDVLLWTHAATSAISFLDLHQPLETPNARTFTPPGDTTSAPTLRLCGSILYVGARRPYPDDRSYLVTYELRSMPNPSILNQYYIAGWGRPHICCLQKKLAVRGISRVAILGVQYMHMLDGASR